MEFDYDVALSFAGENREYVHEVAEILHAIGIKVFYDKFYEIDIWGKNLYDKFDEVYHRNSEYCVMFISQDYKKRAWSNHERQSAQARDFIEKEYEYILPVRFDDTEIPGLRHTIAFIDARTNSPEELAYKLAKKINPDFDLENMLKILRDWLSDRYEINVKGTQIEFINEQEDFYAVFPLRMVLEIYKLGELEQTFLMSSILL